MSGADEPGARVSDVVLELPDEAVGGELFGPALAAFERDVLPRYLPQQRWFADKNSAAVADVRLLDACVVDGGALDGGAIGAGAIDGGAARGDFAESYYGLVELPAVGHAYFLPVSVVGARSGGDAGALGLSLDFARDDIEARGDSEGRGFMVRVRRGGVDGAVLDGFGVDDFVRGLIGDVLARRRRVGSRGGVFQAYATAGLGELALSRALPIRRLNVEQSNTSVIVDEQIMIKGYRRANRGPQPELEIARFLDAVGYRNTPALLGYLEYTQPDAQTIALAIVQEFARNQGDAWAVAAAHLKRFFAQQSDSDEDAVVLARSRTLGVRTAELQRAFATSSGDAAFEPEPTTADDLAEWAAQARETAERALDALERDRGRVPETIGASVDALLAARESILARFVPPQLTGALMKTRYHGDYHLGQVLVVGDDYLIVDFEGEPGRDLAARRRKSSPLRDVAGMLRSINYATVSGMLASVGDRDGETAALEKLARDWEQRTSAAFLDGYRTTIAGCASYPAEPAAADALLELFVLEKAFYEVSYELANRPTWLHIPLEGIRAILDADARPVSSD